VISGYLGINIIAAFYMISKLVGKAQGDSRTKPTARSVRSRYSQSNDSNNPYTQLRLYAIETSLSP